MVLKKRNTQFFYQHEAEEIVRINIGLFLNQSFKIIFEVSHTPLLASAQLLRSTPESRSIQLMQAALGNITSKVVVKPSELTNLPTCICSLMKFLCSKTPPNRPCTSFQLCVKIELRILESHSSFRIMGSSPQLLILLGT